MNPADYKHIGPGQDRSLLPLTLGYEVAGIVSALGPDTGLASGGGTVGDEVVAFQILGGYASAVTVNASDVFAKPPGLGFPPAANLLLVGTTASEMLHVTNVSGDDVVLLHGAAGAVGASALQQARLSAPRSSARPAPTTSPPCAATAASPSSTAPDWRPGFGPPPPGKVTVALDTYGQRRSHRRVTGARRRPGTHRHHRRIPAGQGGRARSPLAPRTRPAGRTGPPSGAGCCDWPRMASLEVPIGATYPLDDAPAALRALMGRHPFGKLALVA